MAELKVSVDIVFDRFGALAGQLRQRAGQVVRRTAFAILSDYQRTSRVDTGAQRSSAYVATNGTSTYAGAAAAAAAARPGAPILAEVQRPDPYSAIVGVGVAYAAINEFGGHGRPGDGALTQAAEGQRAAFLAALNQLLEFRP